MRALQDIANPVSPVRVPFSHLQRSGAELRRYGAAPREGVETSETPLDEALDTLDDKVGVAEYKTFCDHHLLPAVLEAARAQQDAESTRVAWNNAVNERNKPKEAQIARLEDELDSGLVDSVHEIDSNTKLLIAESLQAADDCARAGIELGSQALSDGKMKQRSKELRGHVAEVGVPFGVGEWKHFLPKLIEWVLSVVTGTVVGLSAFSFARLISIKRLGTNLPLETLAVGFGIAVTLVGGYAVRLLWQEAAEAYHQEKPWRWKVFVAFVSTLSLVVVETVVDQQGLMAAEKLTATLASVSGKTAAHGPDELTMLILGCVAALPYFIYSAIRGWRQCGLVARNRIEYVGLPDARETKEDTAWIEAIRGQNRLTVLARLTKQIEEANTQRNSLLRKRINELRESLEQERTEYTEAEIGRMERANAHAEGQQQEADRRLMALRQKSVYEPPKPTTSKRVNKGLIAWLSGFFQRRNAAEGVS